MLFFVDQKKPFKNGIVQKNTKKHKKTQKNKKTQKKYKKKQTPPPKKKNMATETESNEKMYVVEFFNDMGHLNIRKNSTIPELVRKFAYDKIFNKIRYATDKFHLGLRYFILKEDLFVQWKYHLFDMTILLDYSNLDRFDSKKMVFIDESETDQKEN